MKKTVVVYTHLGNQKTFEKCIEVFRDNSYVELRCGKLERSADENGELIRQGNFYIHSDYEEEFLKIIETMEY